MSLSSSRCLARLVALLSSLYCLIAAAAEPPGWLVLFDTSASLRATDIVTIDRFVMRITLTLATPTREDPPGGANRVDVDITPPGGGAAFRKTDVPITLLSEPLP